MIFVDTGAWYALLDKDDQHHEAAKQWYEHNQVLLVTSNYVVVETLNLTKVRLGSRIACQWDEAFLTESIAQLLWVNQEDHQRASHFFHKYADKGWSFTDCSSFVLMERLKINTAFAFDRHFEQYAGFTRVPAIRF
ncbi:MAG: type II toxin-antitoxin system VapC family toxin [Candidatus Sericytochromatia bacterium]